MGNMRIPTAVAVTAWIASGLAVMGYTYLAFKETASDLEGAALSVEGDINPLVASAGVIAAATSPGSQKPLDRGKFTKTVTHLNPFN